MTLSATDRDRILQQVFGFDGFRNGQKAVIDRLLAGQSVLAIFPTGGGKSLCYQLPALMLDGLTLVISPLIALMKDQIDFLLEHRVAAARLDSSLDEAEAKRVLDDLRARRIKLLYIAPERLGNERFLQLIRGQKISLLAIDEAHCISEWGHNFRPDYLRLASLAKELRVERVLALTATATPQVAKSIAASFAILEEAIIHTGFYRPNLHLIMTPCHAHARDELLTERIKSRGRGPTIVYVTLQKTTEEVAAFLNRKGFEAYAYHAGMKSEDRHRVQDTFMASERAIICATIAFGMGVDKSDIRYIYHYNLPKGFENYVQEIGRAGRDGAPSVCELLACPEDVGVLENFARADTPTVEALSAVIRDVLGRGATFDISISEHSRRYQVRPIVIETLFAYLELEGVLRPTGAFYSAFKFKFIKSPEAVCAKFNPDRAAFLRRVFQAAHPGKIWLSIDPEAIASDLGESRSRIMAALSYLDETGDICLQASGLRHTYRVLQQPEDITALSKRLGERFKKREADDLLRIRRMVRFTEDAGCLTRRLLAYFGEERGNCGHCSECDNRV